MYNYFSQIISFVTTIHIIESCHWIMFLGACITSASLGDVCGLNSVAAECISFNASRCKCNAGYQSKDGLICESEYDSCGIFY